MPAPNDGRKIPRARCDVCKAYSKAVLVVRFNLCKKHLRETLDKVDNGGLMKCQMASADAE